MQALVFEHGRAHVRKVRRPRLRPGFALVRVIASGICNTDLELQRGYHGFSGIPGHEFVGVVEGPEGSALLGKRVVGEINLACGRCDWCRRGLGRHCPQRTVLGIRKHPGAHAEYLTLPEDNLYKGGIHLTQVATTGSGWLWVRIILGRWRSLRSGSVRRQSVGPICVSCGGRRAFDVRPAVDGVLGRLAVVA